MALSILLSIYHRRVALLPLLNLLIFPVVARWKAGGAGPVGMYAARVLALSVFRTPFNTDAGADPRGDSESCGY